MGHLGNCLATIFILGLNARVGVQLGRAKALHT